MGLARGAIGFGGSSQTIGGHRKSVSGRIRDTGDIKDKLKPKTAATKGL
jgi:hypothetical protein